jgi:hypothetical protein
MAQIRRNFAVYTGGQVSVKRPKEYVARTGVTSKAYRICYGKIGKRYLEDTKEAEWRTLLKWI